MFRKAFLILPLLALTATGCLRAGADASVLEIKASEYVFNLEEKPLNPGLTTIRVSNAGKEPHQAQIARPRKGVTRAAVFAALEKGDDEFFKAVEFVGGPTSIAPGTDQYTQARLTPGGYLLFCFFPTADGTAAHFQKGMIGSFTVRDGTEKPAQPATKTTVEAKDFSYDIPSKFDGNGTFELTNKGTQPHEFSIVKLQPGASIEDVFAAFDGKSKAPKFTWAGGLAAVNPGSSAWFRVTLAPGRYVAFCLVPDPAKKAPHAALGMSKEFIVK